MLALDLGGSVVKVLSQIDVWCLPLHLPHPRDLHWETACPDFAQLKQSLLLFRNSLLLATSCILVHSELGESYSMHRACKMEAA